MNNENNDLSRNLGFLKMSLEDGSSSWSRKITLIGRVWSEVTKYMCFCQIIDSISFGGGDLLFVITILATFGHLSYDAA